LKRTGVLHRIREAEFRGDRFLRPVVREERGHFRRFERAVPEDEVVDLAGEAAVFCFAAASAQGQRNPRVPDFSKQRSVWNAPVERLRGERHGQQLQFPVSGGGNHQIPLAGLDIADPADLGLRPVVGAAGQDVEPSEVRLVADPERAVRGRRGRLRQHDAVFVLLRRFAEKADGKSVACGQCFHRLRIQDFRSLCSVEFQRFAVIAGDEFRLAERERARRADGVVPVAVQGVTGADFTAAEQESASGDESGEQVSVPKNVHNPPFPPERSPEEPFF